MARPKKDDKRICLQVYVLPHTVTVLSATLEKKESCRTIGRLAAELLDRFARKEFVKREQSDASERAIIRAAENSGMKKVPRSSNVLTSPEELNTPIEEDDDRITLEEPDPDYSTVKREYVHNGVKVWCTAEEHDQWLSWQE